MRIVLIGQARFAEDVLKALLEKGAEVVAVYAPPDASGRPDSLKVAVEAVGIPVFQPPKMRAPEVYQQYIKLEPELNVMAFVTDILPQNILDYPRFGSIQYHPSLLPKHRGGSAINWAIINGETKTGITIFWTVAGIDTGPILLQKEADITHDDTVGSLYFDKLYQLGLDALVESVDLIRDKKAPRIPQDESLASYEPLCDASQAAVNWFQPVTTVYNLIRGSNPQPGATTSFGGNSIKLFDSELLNKSAGSPAGEITEISDKGITIAGNGGAILVKRLQPPGSAKIPAVEYAQSVSLKVGDRFESVGK